MLRTLVKTEAIQVEDRVFRIRYFEQRTARGLRRFTAEIHLDAGDRIILDDDSMMNLETRTTRLFPATIYSRLLAKATAA